MDKIDSLILPRILEIISQTPNLCETVDNLCKAMEEYMASESPVKMSSSSIRRAVKKALDRAQSLGIVSVVIETLELQTEKRATEAVGEAPRVNNKRGRSSLTNRTKTKRKGRPAKKKLGQNRWLKNRNRRQASKKRR
ncbi:uncharacterized protein LOC106085445 isoform X1 [Stomoxys calcitrans]|uniref:uncharacterized protein LOC106085445 isoform X1 n=2 Tax=Stomoxys calcitrans TaxID=35570 RepID=UPI0027E37A75|nr:uncharacterized protein LOC106085445 isoform X1 [Stomoxys calcitrans]